jgi:hypothetical protein
MLRFAAKKKTELKQLKVKKSKIKLK